MERLLYEIHAPTVLDQVYGRHDDAALTQIDWLSTLYDLPDLNCSLNMRIRTGFDYAARIAALVVLVLYTADRRVFLYLSADGDGDIYTLPASKVAPGTSLEDAVTQLAAEIVPHQELTGVEPVALMQHTFHFPGPAGSETHVQKGVAYVARVVTQPGHALPEPASVSPGTWFPAREARGFVRAGLVPRYTNGPILNLALDRIESLEGLRVPHPDIEITQNKVAARRYRLHERFVKPIFSLLKRSGDFDRLAMKAIGTPQRFLDASCGDSSMLLKVLNQGAGFCVGNDISWSQIMLLRERISGDAVSRVHFTTHNVVSLPFEQAVFDTVLIKNTLHHLNSGREFQLAMRSLARVARKLVIIEVEKSEKPIAKFVNWYYRRFLNDAGSCFFTEKQFCAAVTDEFREDASSVQFSRFNCLHGDVLIAEVILRKEAAYA